MSLGFYGLRPGFGGLALLALLGNGFCVAALIPAQTSLYETIDREFRGRAFALFGAAMAAAPLPGYFLAGTLAASVASTTVIALCGLAVVAQATVTSVQLARVGGRGAAA